ncbi:thiol reductant ABC exporter subunit CydC [Microvirga terricola]|uniref:Thiol reductant ABC exporter subunit CydC n=1 Tax=Microvirga terricola TaxID=2719797 RepID=A0ABX0VE54_9HYPH|nr:thiol reductant ABC exporter subunit CydC [Microvirga terricola]NIX78114.1 thiol reductant ABC exporter subunit CydC [Microvirga terricola]
MKALFSFSPFFAHRSGAFLLAIALSVLTLGAGVGLLGVSGWFLTGAALTTAGVAFNLFGPSALVRGFSFLRIVSRYGEKLVGHDATLRLLADLRGWQFRRLIPRVPLQGKAWRRGDLVSRLTADIDALDTVFLSALGPIATALVLGTAMTAVLAWYLQGAGLVYELGFFGASLVLPAILVLAAIAPGEAAVGASADLRMAVLDGVEGHTDLRALGATAWAQQTFTDASAHLQRAKTRQATIAAIGNALVQLFAGVTLVGLLWIGLDAHSAGALGGPLLVGLLLASLGSFEVALSIVRSASRLGAAQAAAQRVKALSETAPAVRDVDAPKELPQGGSVTFENVCFGYVPHRPVLDEVNLQVGAGERVALIGASGSGKSTILSLLLRLADAQAGTVRVAGENVAQVVQADLHRRVALLSQDTPVFLGTIRDNLLIGKPDANSEDCRRALTAARLDAFVSTLPDGLETWLGEAGRTLSAGQARRLCLARVLLSQASIIALDEPTSGLDPETERDFLSDLSAATSGRTVLIATHAKLAPGMVERVYRLDNGRLSLSEA